MAVYQELPKFSKSEVQECPFCKMLHPIFIRGTAIPRGEEGLMIFPDVGYSFCNCKNIWYTGWKNINQEVYDDLYAKKNTHEKLKNMHEIFFSRFKDILLSNTKPNSEFKFLDIGSLTSYVLDCAKKLGAKTFGNDIFLHKDFGHELIVGSFEKVDIKETFDVIWASHVFEHFKDPLSAISKCHNILNNKGRILIAMPDPMFIDWDNPYTWQNWHLREHHIMWDMDSFAKEMELAGFDIISTYRNTDYDLQSSGDFRIIAEKK